MAASPSFAGSGARSVRMARPVRTAPFALCAAMLGLFAQAAHAQHSEDGYWLHLAGYRPSIESTARSDVLVGSSPGTTVRFEDELGLASRETLPWFSTGMRLGTDWRVELEYFSLRRSGTKSISRDIVWSGVTYPASATLSSRFDSDILRLSAGWSFLRTDRTELGAVFGLHTTRFTIELAGQTSLGGATAGGQARAQDALLPLPTLGLYGKHDFSRALSVQGRVDYFTLSYGDYSGGLVNVMAALGYRITDNVGLALGYRYVDYAVDITRPKWLGSVEYRFSGPFMSLQLGF